MRRAWTRARRVVACLMVMVLVAGLVPALPEPPLAQAEEADAALAEGLTEDGGEAIALGDEPVEGDPGESGTAGASGEEGDGSAVELGEDVEGALLEQLERVASEAEARGDGVEVAGPQASVAGPDVEAQSTGVSVSNPRVVADSGMEAGQVTTWDCVWFGSYPQTEVTSADAAYASMQSASWDANGDATVGGKRYRRISEADTTRYLWWEINEQDWGYPYKSFWPSGSSTYRYFRYEPVKWRVLSVSGSTALVVADVALDSQMYNTELEGVTWETSSVRSWLNGYGASSNQPRTDFSSRGFLQRAFSASERADVLTTSVENADNTDYGTPGGNNTSDKVFLLSEAEVYDTSHGFASSYGTYDEARRCKTTDYARAMGAWVYDYGDVYDGNCWWWLRSPGYRDGCAARVGFDGCVYRGGDSVDASYNAVRPALNLNLTSSILQAADTVSSNGDVDEGSDCKIARVTITKDGKATNLLEGTVEVDPSGSGSFSLAATLEAGSPQASAFALYQMDGEQQLVVATAGASGSFGTIACSRLTEGLPCYVSVTNTSGKVTQSVQIGLVVSAKDCRIARVTITKDGKATNLLEGTVEVDPSGSESFSLSATLQEGSPKASAFTLYQMDGEQQLVVATAGASGSFGTIACSRLTEGLPCYVSVTNEGGKVTQSRQIGLVVILPQCKLSMANVRLDGKVTDVLKDEVTIDTLDSSHVLGLMLYPTDDSPKIREAVLYQKKESGERIIATMGPTLRVGELKSSLFEPDLPCHVRLTSEKGRVSNVSLHISVRKIGYKIGSVTYSCEGDNCDVLSEERDLLLPETASDALRVLLTARLEDQSKTATRFTLYQKDEKHTTQIATAGADGRFEVKTTSFEEGVPCYVSVTGKDGKVADTKRLLLNVLEENYPTELEIAGDKVTFNNFPFKGATLEIPDVKVPIHVKLSSGGTFQAGINIGDETNVKSFDTLSDSAKLTKLKQCLTKPSTWKGKGKVDARSDVAAYVEGDLKTGMYRFFIMTKISISAEGEWQLPPPASVVVVGIGGHGEVSGSSSLGVKVKRAKIVSCDSAIGYGGEFGLDAWVGAGMANVISLDFYGSGKLGLNGSYAVKWSGAGAGENCLEEVYLSGELGAMVRLVGNQIRVPFVSGKKSIYKANDSASIQSEGVEDIWSALSEASETEFQPIGREYLSQTTSWDGEIYDDEPNRLQGSVYPDTQLTCVDVAGGKLMVFLADDASRTDANRSVLMWSRYDDEDGEWSEPKAVWQDGTADYTPDLCADGNGGAWVTWRNARQPIEDGSTLFEQAALLDVAVAHFDAGAGSFRAQGYVSDGADVQETSPRVGVWDGKAHVAWVTSALDDPFGLGNSHDVVVCSQSGGAWKETARQSVAGVVSALDAGGLGGPAVCWAVDADGNLSTTDDSCVYAWASGQVALLADGGAMNPQFATAGGDDAVVWCESGNLVYTKTGAAGFAVATALEQMPATSFSVWGDVLGDALVTYRRYGDNHSNVYDMRSSGGVWADEVPLTCQGQSITRWWASLANGRVCVAYAASTETAEDSTDCGIWYEESGGFEACRVDGAYFEDGTLSTVLTNVGSKALREVELVVSEDGYEVACEDVDVSLGAGESGLFLVGLDWLDDGDEHTYEVQVSPSVPDAQAVSFDVRPDVRLDTSVTHKVGESSESFACSVTNVGEWCFWGGACEFFNKETGEELFWQEIGELDAGESQTITYVSGASLYDQGVTAVGVRITDDDGNVYSERVLGTWDGSFTTEFDPNAPGSDKKKTPQITVENTLVGVGQTASLGASVTDGAGSLSFWSLDETVVTVDDEGVLTGVSAGTATVIVSTAANDAFFAASKEVSVEVGAADIAKASVLAITAQTYSGKAITPKPTVSYNGTTLRLGTDYALSYKNNVNVGTATVTVTGKGDYTGTVKVTFKIVAASLSGATITGIKGKTYNGKAQTQVPTVKVGGRTLKAGADYALSYKNNVNAGTATLYVKGKGNYAGTAKRTFKIAKAANPIKVKAVTRTANSTKLKKKAQLVAAPLKFVKKAQGKVSYTRVSKGSAKQLKVITKTGEVTVAKGTKKGTYKVVIKVTAAGTANYKAASTTLTCKVVVK